MDGGYQLFVDDGAESDVSLTSTVQSEELEEYPVESILAEERGDDGEPWYLLKWKGYPRWRSTWEQKGNLHGTSMVEDWAIRKRKIAEGIVPPFDISDFEEEVEKEHEKADCRRARRKVRKYQLAREREEEAREKPARRSSRKILPRAAKSKDKILHTSLFASGPADFGTASVNLSHAGAVETSQSDEDFVSSDSESDPNNDVLFSDLIGEQESNANSPDVVLSSSHVKRRRRSPPTSEQKKTKSTPSTLESATGKIRTARSPCTRGVARVIEPNVSDIPSTSTLSVPVAIGRQSSFDSLFDSTPEGTAVNDARAVAPGNAELQSASRRRKATALAEGTERPSRGRKEARRLQTPGTSAIMPRGLIQRSEDATEPSGKHSEQNSIQQASSRATIGVIQATGDDENLATRKSTNSSATTAAPEAASEAIGKSNGVQSNSSERASFEQALVKAKEIRDGSTRENDQTTTTATPVTEVSTTQPARKTQSTPVAASTSKDPTPSRTARRTGPSIFSNWNEPKQRDMRKKLEEKSTAKSGDGRFRGLAQQHSIQKWANSELAPDPSALRTVDPRTGRVEDLQRHRPNTTTNKPASGLRHDTNMYAESSTPGQSLYSAPSSSMYPAQSPGVSISVAPAVPMQSARPGPVPSMVRPTATTCPFWLKGHCMKSSDCTYAHVDTGRYVTKIVKCRYYPNCRFSDEKCMYLHEDEPAQTSREGYAAGRSYADIRSERREESPDLSGLRQDEIDHRRDERRRSSLAQPQAPITSTPSSVAAYEEATFERRQVAGSSHANPVLGGPLQSLDHESPTSRSSSLDPSTSPTHVNAVASPDIMNLGPSAIASELSVAIDIRSPGKSTQAILHVKLVFDVQARSSRFNDIIAEGAGHIMQNICLVKDFQRYCYDDNRSWTSGDVLPEGVADQVSQLTEYLIMNAAGAIVQHEHFIMVLYSRDAPANEWAFLGSPSKSNSALRFHVQRTTTEEHAITEDQLPQNMSDLSVICKKELGLEEYRMFQGNKGKRLEKNVFIMFPSRDMPEVQLITAWLLECGATVYHFNLHGSWSLFTSTLNNFSGSGVILFHPSMTRYWQMPSFHRMLFTGQYNFFQIGTDNTLKHHPRAATDYSSVRLFPLGSLTLITDDVFEYHPKLAANVLRDFCTRSDKKPKGARNDRILTRPGIKEWLLDLVQKYPQDKNTEYRKKAYEYAWQLLECFDESQHDFEMIDPPLLISWLAKDMPNYVKLWDRDEAEATDMLVQWFAGFCMIERESFRRFIVVHEQSKRLEQTPGAGTEKDPREWSKKYNHIKIMNVRRWLESGGGK